MKILPAEHGQFTGSQTPHGCCSFGVTDQGNFTEEVASPQFADPFTTFDNLYPAGLDNVGGLTLFTLADDVVTRFHMELLQFTGHIRSQYRDIGSERHVQSPINKNAQIPL